MRPFFLATLFAVTTIACAQVTTTTKNHKAVIHDVRFGGCHFAMPDPFKGEISLTTRSTPVSANYNGPLYPAPQNAYGANDLWIQMLCKPTAKVDKTLCGLELDNGNIITNGLEGFSEEEKRQIKKDLNQTLIILNGKNWKGAGIQEDQINGDEELRTRSFNFCIPFGDRIVKGRVESAAQLNNLKESAMPNIIKLLEGIEFIDEK